MDEVDGQVDCHSLGNGDSIDLNCLLSNSRGTVKGLENLMQVLDQKLLKI